MSEKKPKVPLIYKEFFPMVAETTASRVWAKICINVVFLEIFISSLITVRSYEAVSVVREETANHTGDLLLRDLRVLRLPKEQRRQQHLVLLHHPAAGR